MLEFFDFSRDDDETKVISPSGLFTITLTVIAVRKTTNDKWIWCDGVKVKMSTSKGEKEKTHRGLDLL